MLRPDAQTRARLEDRATHFDTSIAAVIRQLVS
jgi:hypothetical protein